MPYDQIIIGGGASGLFCALRLAQLGQRPAVVEHMDKVGKKLLITGKGRCNLTNNCSAEEAMRNIPRNSKFMYSSLNRFSPADTMDFFQNLGVQLKTERGGRVFPASDNSREIVDSLETQCKKLGVKFIFDNALELIVENSTVLGIKCNKSEYYGKSTIIACGGMSYPVTGSTGDGYKMAKSVGHKITDIFPSLCPIEVIEAEECAGAMGLSLKNCTLTLREEARKKPVFSQLGEILFTHFGLSGPLVLSASANIDNTCKNKYFLDIDLKPALDEKKLDMRIQRDFVQFPNREFQNSLDRLLPSGVIPIIVKRCGIPQHKRVNQITKEERISLVRKLKKLTFQVKKLRPIKEAIITRGGVDISEIDPKTMQSKICNNLYFIGEILDVDGYTGGFNLQIAFSTANACAEDCAF